MRIVKGAFLVTFFVVWSGVVLAQHNISEGDLRKRQDQAYAKLKTLSYRIERVTEMYDDLEKPVTQRSKVIELHVPPSSTHFIVRNERGASATTTETISIAGIRYVKESGKAWALEDRGSGSGGGRGYGRWGDPSVQPQVETTVVNKGQDSVNGVSGNLFVLTRRYIFPDKISTIVEQIWFDQQGLLLRSLTEGDGGRPKRFLQKTDTIYTYDPAIKIVAPI